MKYLVLLGDGMADRPLEDHDGRTPLQIAHTPAMDRLAAAGTLGMVATVPEGFEPGSDVANMCVLGYNPARHYTGRAPIEAVSMGVALAAQDITFRCNLVTFGDAGGRITMDDYSAGHISTEDAHRFITLLKEELDGDGIEFHPGISYRHLMVWENGEGRMTATPPHDITGCETGGYLPHGPGADRISDLMQRSQALLADHPLNRERISQGKKPVSSIWLWGHGNAVKIPSFPEKYGVSGSVISAVDLVKGLGISASLTSIDVPGATGYLDTNYAGKVSATLHALETGDFVYLHVEAPDEAGHKGNFSEKVQAIDDFDAKIVQPVLQGLEQRAEPFRLLVLPDHPTPLEIKTHSAEPVPFILYDSRDTGAHARSYCEQDACCAGVTIQHGWTLMDRLIRGDA